MEEKTEAKRKLDELFLIDKQSEREKRLINRTFKEYLMTFHKDFVE